MVPCRFQMPTVAMLIEYFFPVGWMKPPFPSGIGRVKVPWPVTAAIASAPNAAAPPFNAVRRANGGALRRQLAQSLQSQNGLPHAWVEVLMRLSRSPGQQLKMSTLADQIALTTGGITRLIDRMEAAGYVERSPCASDRRVSYAGITESGREALQLAIPVVVTKLRELFDGFAVHELSTLDDLLDRLR